MVKAKTGVEICKIEALPSETVESIKKKVMGASKIPFLTQPKSTGCVRC